MWSFTFAAADSSSARQFRRQQLDLLDVRRCTEQGGCVRHQRGGDLAVQVSLAAGLVRKSVKDAER